MTTLETKLMNVIAHDEYNPLNGETPTEYTDVWTWTNVENWAREIEISVNECKGVLGSLKKKRLIMTDSESTSFTRLGFSEWEQTQTII